MVKRWFLDLSNCGVKVVHNGVKVVCFGEKVVFRAKKLSIYAAFGFSNYKYIN